MFTLSLPFLLFLLLISSLLFGLEASSPLNASSPLAVSDQNNQSHRLAALIGSREGSDLLILYRSRKAAEAGDRHLELVQEWEKRRNTGAGKGAINVIRVADLSRVPRLFRGLAARQLKKEFSGAPYYIDTTGSVADHFGLENDQYGLFFFQRDREVLRGVFPFTNLDAMDGDITQFLGEAPLGQD